jgi:hypothetical protein
MSGSASAASTYTAVAPTSIVIAVVKVFHCVPPQLGDPLVGRKAFRAQTQPSTGSCTALLSASDLRLYRVRRWVSKCVSDRVEVLAGAVHRQRFMPAVEMCFRRLRQLEVVHIRDLAYGSD